MKRCRHCAKVLGANHLIMYSQSYCDWSCFRSDTAPKPFHLKKFREGQGGEYADLEQQGGGIEKDS